MSFQLTEEQLRKIILQELYGVGLNASKPSIQKFPKSLEREELRDSPAPSIEIDNIEEDIPLAADPRVSPNARLRFTIPLGETKEAEYQKLLTKRIKQFQAWWRSMDTDIRYGVELWLRQQLIKRILPAELQQLVAQHTAAAKGLSEPQNKNRKPR